MPARFQTNDVDFGHLNNTVRDAGGVLLRNSGTDRFQEALQPLGLPLINLQTSLASEPHRMGLFFQRTAHLTPRGHDAVAGALFDFFESSGLAPRAPSAR